jgi:hypothetical protein
MNAYRAIMSFEQGPETKKVSGIETSLRPIDNATLPMGPITGRN